MSFFFRRRSDGAVVNILQESRSEDDDSPSAASASIRGFPNGPAIWEIPAEQAKLEADSRLVFYTDPKSVATDRFRYLRMRLREFASLGKLQSLLITSAVPKDGKSTTALNLATALAEEGKRRVLLVEADLHQPTLRRQLGLENSAGLAEALEDHADPIPLIRRIDPLGFCLLAAGNPRGNPTELLQSDVLPAVLRKIQPAFEWVLFDSPPLAPLTDALALARHADASLLVVRAGKSPRALVEKAFELLGRKHVLGVVLNEIPGVDRVYSKYYGSYSSKALLDPAAAESSKPLGGDKQGV